MSEMPARIWVEDTRDGAWFGHPRSAYAVEFIRADIAERMAEALESAIKFVESEMHYSQPAPDMGEEPSDRFTYDAVPVVMELRSALSAWKDGR